MNETPTTPLKKIITDNIDKIEIDMIISYEMWIFIHFYMNKYH